RGRWALAGGLSCAAALDRPARKPQGQIFMTARAAVGTMGGRAVTPRRLTKRRREAGFCGARCCQKYAQFQAHKKAGVCGDLRQPHERRATAPRGMSMRLLTGIVGVLLVGAAAQASAETTRFAIMRNGEQIGTHVFEVNRSGSETTV